MTNTVGRAKRGDWVEGVTFKPKAAARKAGRKGAGLPMGSGTGLGFEQGGRGLAPPVCPQVLPGFGLLYWDHGPETTLAAPGTCGLVHSSFSQPPLTSRNQDPSLGLDISRLTLVPPPHYLCPLGPETSPKS